MPGSTRRCCRHPTQWFAWHTPHAAHEKRVWHQEHRAASAGRGAGNGRSQGQIAARLGATRRVIPCGKCGGLVDFMRAMSAARRKDDALTDTAGCSARGCSKRHRPTERRAAQRRMAMDVLSGRRKQQQRRQQRQRKQRRQQRRRQRRQRRGQRRGQRRQRMARRGEAKTKAGSDRVSTNMWKERNGDVTRQRRRWTSDVMGCTVRPRTLVRTSDTDVC